MPSRYADTWIPLGRWARQHGYGNLRLLSRAEDTKFALNTTNGTFTALAGTLLANWDGLELHLGFEPQLIGNQIFLHTLDLKKNLEPLIHSPELQWRERPVIVVDPGHGGQNTGASNMASGLCEKEFTLDWARRLERLLTDRGWQVYLTRTNDVDVTLSNRVAFAQEHRADLFISLHFNSAAPSQEQAGLETYCLTPAGMPSTLTRGYEDDLTAIFPNNSFDEQNLQCAVLLHRALLPVVGYDRGVRRARFLGVLRGQSRAAVLIEAGFLSNPREARLIADPEYRQRLAEAMARALAPAASSRQSQD
ncbi:MAG TPA: N-acetylmuramoyl-L-alanine amidase [Verrucomicrobiae bacterium]|nr:N-acetylmuramoyl-L-alanine amidase [Verrucomicrobiae bacterium]